MHMIFACAIFISAFLLFFVQPLFAKKLLPLFGGSAFVWMVCLFFFQTALLLGYLYAYLLARYFSGRYQAILHLLLIAMSFYFIPLNFNLPISVDDHTWPPLAELMILSSDILVPFMVLSASSPLLQHWYVALHEIAFPYRYYAISNAGSLIGLLGYPLFFEPSMRIGNQAVIWSVLYSVYAVLCMVCLFQFSRKTFPSENSQDKRMEPRIPLTAIVQWFSLTFLSSCLLFSITQFLSQNIINMPFVWILPLAAYLITYIVTFSKKEGYHRSFWLITFLGTLLFSTWFIFNKAFNESIIVGVFVGLLFSACMVCHGELVRSKPKEQHLTLFYLWVAFGGVMGGLVTQLLSIFVFTDWWDFYLPLWGLGVISFILCWNGYRNLLPGFDVRYPTFGAITMVAFSLTLCRVGLFPIETLVDQHRNLYGMLRVYDHQFEDTQNNIRVLMHGTIAHGLEYQSPGKKGLPTSYYGEGTGVYAAVDFMRNYHKGPMKIGVVGLGAGTLSALTREGDKLDFYEIDPDVIRFADKHFDFLRLASGETSIILGDARIELQKASERDAFPRYDILIIDAFSGDVIPVHLLTKEALALYSRLIKSKGMIAFHTSNRHIDLHPVTKALGIEKGCAHYWVENNANVKKQVNLSTWALISCHPDLGEWLREQKGPIIKKSDGIKALLWEDDFNSVLPLMKR